MFFSGCLAFSTIKQSPNVLSIEYRGDNCQDWSIKKQEIETLYKFLIFENSYSQDQFYNHHSCDAFGKMIINGSEYDYFLNPGGYMYVKNSDTAYYLGCDSIPCSEYFLSTKISGDKFREMMKDPEDTL